MWKHNTLSAPWATGNQGKSSNLQLLITSKKQDITLCKMQYLFLTDNIAQNAGSHATSIVNQYTRARCRFAFTIRLLEVTFNPFKNSYGKWFSCTLFPQYQETTEHV